MNANDAAAIAIAAVKRLGQGDPHTAYEHGWDDCIQSAISQIAAEFRGHTEPQRKPEQLGLEA